MFSEEFIFNALCYTMLGLSIPTFIASLVEKKGAPYGRYNDGKSPYGFDVNGVFAWVFQECPTVVWGVCLAVIPETTLLQQSTANLLLFSYFMFHYMYRSFWYPFLLKDPKPTPVGIMMMAWLFCTINGYLQVRNATYFHYYDDEWLTDPRFIIGSILFWGGLAINHHSDYLLRNLRKPGEKGYKIPQGGMFNLVSGANFFGEILEWTGFAIATWSLPGLAFAVFTFSNIGPRGAKHHQNYLERFGDKYPKNRKAVIPFIW
eukprot:CAMPEP_0201510278 /NCGR_PEP_ID=MMETSP0161_2-20130828/3035_1 /ASSEMBLY_ACC=CAM_ASM_000251 /TAXON_ID=180227 /ORGANISM="Neoparamoeba aestuarina, Strain SoJaBio B1-5/56/2" /LENGTH=260 /DNA_ID=CAMNT_0047905427 /DNA_START=37 /DNA_END=819 /DNA_ORIENTATION=-